MRLVVQRVSWAAVTWSEPPPGGESEIGAGLLVLVGAGAQDRAADLRRLAAKLAHLRLFADAAGRSNLSLLDVQGQVLVISQFTLYADLSRGRRPSFLGAGDPQVAEQLCADFAGCLEEHGIRVRQGRFGAHMKVRLENDGPVTLVLSSDEWPTRLAG